MKIIKMFFPELNINVDLFTFERNFKKQQLFKNIVNYPSNSSVETFFGIFIGFFYWI